LPKTKHLLCHNAEVIRSKTEYVSFSSNFSTACRTLITRPLTMNSVARNEFSAIDRAIMITGFDRLRPTAAPFAIGLCAIGLCATSLLIGADAAAAAEAASRWDGDARSAVRLIAGSSPAGKTAPIRAGVEVRIKAGWHTYWRYPGDAGVPPRFDFTGSQNVAAVEVLWPAPQRIPEQGLVAIGYVSDVIWPLAIVPQDRAKPVTLRLKLDYAVCEKLCVPAQGTAELALTDRPSSQDAALAAALARLPKKLAVGEGSPLAIRRVAREEHQGIGARLGGLSRDRPEAGPARARIVVDVAAPPGTSVAMFAEGPTADWALPVPTAIDGAPAGLQRFAFDLDGAPPGAKYQGALITLTAVAGNIAIEVATHLD
jgi:DsbC/DsbD-like thiol-disulfide interchange protein